MKAQFRLLIAAIALIAVSFSSCKKDKDSSTSNSDYTSELSSQSDDQARISDAVDEVADDANNVLSDHPSLTGRLTNLTCNATAVVDSLSNPRTVTITYNGANCGGNHTRVGVVVLSMPAGTHWRDAGAVLTIDVQNLKITRLRDGKSITINGTKTITNVSGGLVENLGTSTTTITHNIATTSTGLTITFDNGSQRVWNVSKQRVFSYNNGIVITTTGTHTDGTLTDISEWGTNRFGNDFVTEISSPMIVRQDCDFRLVSGQVKHDRLAADVVVTFGLDAQGLPTSCPGAGETYYFKLVWTGNNGVVRTVILPY
ncbi:MAG: hypothetical protein ABI402_04745 [Ferruginibacter sp.]